ncbi:MAG: ribbon-helix-helix protein, CopG family [Lachnospiraceae bacterium]|nr:ribbon-helix-helix protein, CopG family [Lachnospiraceae bacterium]
MASKKAGRPPSDNSMTDRIFVRVNKETINKLDECTQELKLSRSDIVRRGIDMVHENLKK